MRIAVLPLVFTATLSLAAARKGEVVPSKFPTPAQGTFTSTQPKPEKLKPGKAADLPGYFVPEDALTGNFKVVDTINGKKIGTGIRVFAFDEVGHGSKLGELPAGSVVQLKAMRWVDKQLFYAIPYEGKIAWINGYFLAPAK